MNVTRKTLAPGVELTHLPATKFKSNMLSMQLAVPMTAETVTANTLIPSVLNRGTRQFPTMGDLSAQMDRLYGVQLNCTVRRLGEVQCVGFVSHFLDDRYTLGGDKLLSPVASLMGQLIGDPVTEDGAFCDLFVKGEQQQLTDAIASIINEKRTYANLRLLQELCAGERYGVSQFGIAEMVERSNAKSLYQDYQALVSTAPLQVIYCGSSPVEEVEQAVMQALSGLPRNYQETDLTTTLHTPRTEIKVVTEAMDVSQGKLGMGFACTHNDRYAMTMGNFLFGGSSNAKLFMNVREKLSLCYYASSGYHREKGIIMVSSGIEFDKYQNAYDEILVQLDAVAKGDWEAWEWDGARSTAKMSFTAMADSQSALEGVYLNQAVTKEYDAPMETLNKLLAVTPEEVMHAMSGVQLDTTYFLKGKD